MTNEILVGVDSGSTSNKISFLNSIGDIESIDISTVIAPTTNKVVNMEGMTNAKDVNPEDLLHVHIKSNALPPNEQDSFWYVGEYAKDKEGRSEAKDEEKIGNKKHIITTLSGLAIIALKLNVENPEFVYFGGLPIEEFKSADVEEASRKIIGTHEFEFLDGVYRGRKVTINIKRTKLIPEGVIAHLGLRYDVKNNELIETPLFDKISSDFVLTDLGSGTFDTAVFENNILNKYASYNKKIGTNKYVDDILSEINELETFKEKGFEPYKTRSQFVKKVVIPAMNDYISNDKKKVKFVIKWGLKQTEDVTSIVLKYMEAYASACKSEIEIFLQKFTTDQYFLVGGGLLFGYVYLNEMKEQFTFPSNILEAPYFNSRAFLIANIIQRETSKKETV